MKTFKSFILLLSLGIPNQAIILLHFLKSLKMLQANHPQFAERYLTAIEKKHTDYFTESNLKILDCVQIVGNPIASVHITKDDLPFEIRYEIESMFWR